MLSPEKRCESMIDGSKVPGCASAAALRTHAALRIRQVIDVERTVPEAGSC
jgi:hypothetical protein